MQSYQPLTSVTGTRSETSLLNVPQAIDVVPQQVITDQAVSSLDEALANVSGITCQHAGRQDAVMKRGFGDNRDGSILRDGGGAGAQFPRRPPSGWRCSGPASMLYGMGEPGGMINMITKAPAAAAYPRGRLGQQLQRRRRPA
ncbi:TonB-dependent receptor plug domain-containing protein [Serratia ureilytica]